MTIRAGARAGLRWLPAVAVMALLFVLSSQSGLRVSEDVAVERPIRFSGHLLAYATLAALLLWALARGGQPRPRDVILAFGIAVAYGAIDELHQSLVPDRNGRLQDVVTDALGAAIGTSLAWAVLALRRRAMGTAAPMRASVDRQEGRAPGLDPQREDPQARR